MTTSVPIQNFNHPDGYGSITIFSRGERLCSYSKLPGIDMNQELHILHVDDKVHALPFTNSYVWLSKNIKSPANTMEDNQLKYFLIVYCKLNTNASYYLLNRKIHEQQ